MESTSHQTDLDINIDISVDVNEALTQINDGYGADFYAIVRYVKRKHTSTFTADNDTKTLTQLVRTTVNSGVVDGRYLTSKVTPSTDVSNFTPVMLADNLHKIEKCLLDIFGSDFRAVVPLDQYLLGRTREFNGEQLSSEALKQLSPSFEVSNEVLTKTSSETLTVYVIQAVQDIMFKLRHHILEVSLGNVMVHCGLRQLLTKAYNIVPAIGHDLFSTKKLRNKRTVRSALNLTLPAVTVVVDQLLGSINGGYGAKPVTLVKAIRSQYRIKSIQHLNELLMQILENGVENGSYISAHRPLKKGGKFILRLMSSFTTTSMTF